MTEALPTPQSIENDAKEAGLSISELCRRTQSATSTFYRWKAGDSSPTLGTVADWLTAIDKAMNAKDRARAEHKEST